MAAHTDNRISIEAPVELVWRLANDVRGWPQLFHDEYAAAEVLEEDGDRIRFRLTTVPDPSGAVWSWESERVADPVAGTVTARRITPGPFLYMHIFQSFTRTAGGTELRWVQDFEVLPTAPVTDAGMAGRVDRNSAVQLARHRKVAERLARETRAGGGPR